MRQLESQQKDSKNKINHINKLIIKGIFMYKKTHMYVIIITTTGRD